MPRIADDQDVEVFAWAAQEPGLAGCEPRRCGDPGRPLVLVFPDRLVPLNDLDARAAQAGDDLRVARIGPLVRPEVQSPHERG